MEEKVSRAYTASKYTYDAAQPQSYQRPRHLSVYVRVAVGRLHYELKSLHKHRRSPSCRVMQLGIGNQDAIRRSRVRVWRLLDNVLHPATIAIPFLDDPRRWGRDKRVEHRTECPSVTAASSGFPRRGGTWRECVERRLTSLREGCRRSGRRGMLCEGKGGGREIGGGRPFKPDFAFLVVDEAPHLHVEFGVRWKV